MDDTVIDIASEEKVSDGKVSFKDYLRRLFVPSSDDEGIRPEGAPQWLVILCSFGLMLMLNQIRLPLFGGAVAISDLAFICSFVPMFAWVILKRRSMFYPLGGIALLLVFCVANLASMAGMAGAFKCAQMIQYIFCGVLMFSFLLENAPGLSCFAVGAALVLNVLAGFIQAGQYGIGSVLAPADVLNLNWGIGGAYTGLFRSRMAFSFFSAGALVWLFPQIVGNRNSLFRSCLAFVFAVVCLLSMVCGQMLLIAVPVLIAEAFVLSRRAGIAAVAAVLVFLCLSAGISGGAHFSAVKDTLVPVKSGAYAGEMKTNHIEFVAAVKMAAKHPFAGVGSGKYQKNVGTFYGELPKPAYNDIATDTQAAWGIVAGTTGFVCAAVLALFLLSSIGTGLRSTISGGKCNSLALGGAACLAVVFLGMFISDPFTRGLAWMPALAFASVVIPGVNEEIRGFRAMPGYALAMGILLGVLVCGVALCGKCGSAEEKCGAGIPVSKTAESAQAEKASGSGVVKDNMKPAPVPGIPMLMTKMFKVLNADSALKVTPPFKYVVMKDTASAKILEVLDNAGKPPEGKEPSMEYGGAVFQVDIAQKGKYKIWVNVWWEGSCGNTLSVQVGDEKRAVTVGNDSTYNQWHWVEVPRTYDFEAGTYPVVILNREDGIKLDQVLVTNDLNYVPTGKEK